MDETKIIMMRRWPGGTGCNEFGEWCNLCGKWSNEDHENSTKHQNKLAHFRQQQWWMTIPPETFPRGQAPPMPPRKMKGAKHPPPPPPPAPESPSSPQFRMLQQSAWSQQTQMNSPPPPGSWETAFMAPDAQMKRGYATTNAPPGQPPTQMKPGYASDSTTMRPNAQPSASSWHCVESGKLGRRGWEEDRVRVTPPQDEQQPWYQPQPPMPPQGLPMMPQVEQPWYQQQLPMMMQQPPLLPPQGMQQVVEQEQPPVMMHQPPCYQPAMMMQQQPPMISPTQLMETVVKLPTETKWTVKTWTIPGPTRSTAMTQTQPSITTSNKRLSGDKNDEKKMPNQRIRPRTLKEPLMISPKTELLRRHPSWPRNPATAVRMGCIEHQLRTPESEAEASAPKTSHPDTDDDNDDHVIDDFEKVRHEKNYVFSAHPYQ